MKHIIKNEQGVALVTALLLTLLSLAFAMALLYLITQGVQVSAAHKRYKSVLEATYGAADVVTKDILPQQMGATELSNMTAFLVGNNFNNLNNPCLTNKLSLIPSQWGMGTVCSTSAQLPDPTKVPDITFTLAGIGMQPNFKVYAKIIDTQPGNSDMSGMEQLDSAAGVAYGASGVSPKHMPATYRIEIQGEREGNPLEKAHLSVLYAY